MEHPHDAGGPLVVGALELQAGHHLGFVGGAHDRGGTGVGHFCEQRPQGDAQAGPVLVGHRGELLAVGAPAELRLGADDEEHVLVPAGDGAGVDLGGRPDDLPQALVVEVDLGAGGGEVVELLGIDIRHQIEVPAVDEVAGRGGGCVACIVPALEGGQHDRLAQGGTGRPPDVVHRPTVPSGTERTARTTTPT